MKVIITGSSGMLGQALCQRLGKEYGIVGLHRDPMNAKSGELIYDIIDRSVIDRIITLKPDLIIHTAANTNVDECESNPEEAYRVNAEGTENIANAAEECKAAMVYISTDYVFDGLKGSPYNELDKPNPINIYGKSKLEGENRVRSLLTQYFIIRTCWLFGEGRNNFISRVIDCAKNGIPIKVWADQIGSPTYAKDLAEAIYRIVQDATQNGIFHITNTGSCSRYKVAKKVLEYLKMDGTTLIPLRFSDAEHLARRPLMSALDNQRYRETFGRTLRHWEDAVREYIFNTEKV